MADSYILNIKPTISNSDGRKMENDLNKRFSRVASKFGGALKTIGSKFKGLLVGGAIAGVGAVLAYPYEALSSKIDETLRTYDDLSARARQLGVTSGRLYQATAVAQSAGIQPDDFRSILTAYAVKLGEAEKGDDLMLKEFVGRGDTITSFFQFMRSLQELAPNERMYYASKVIGEDDSAKLAELINTDFVKRQKEIFRGTTPEQTTRAIEKLADVEGQQSILRSRMNLQDLLSKSQTITTETVRIQNEVAKKQLEIENKQLQSFEEFGRMRMLFEETKLILAEIQSVIAPEVVKGVDLLEKAYNWLQTSKLGKWVGGVFK